MIEINSKILKVALQDNAQTSDPSPTPQDPVGEIMSEKLKRPPKLQGSTYKLKTPDHVSNHALYVTINNIVLNEGTADQEIRPFEIFINSKSMQNFESMLAMTRLMSAIFRKGGDVTFIVDELRAVFAPEGGYWNHGKFQKSLWSEIGDIIDEHFIAHGIVQSATSLMPVEGLTEPLEDTEEPDTDNTQPKLPPCPSCGQYSLVVSGGCETCSACGFSKCG